MLNTHIVNKFKQKKYHGSKIVALKNFLFLDFYNLRRGCILPDITRIMSSRKANVWNSYRRIWSLRQVFVIEDLLFMTGYRMAVSAIWFLKILRGHFISTFMYGLMWVKIMYTSKFRWLVISLFFIKWQV